MVIVVASFTLYIYCIDNIYELETPELKMKRGGYAHRFRQMRTRGAHPHPNEYLLFIGITSATFSWSSALDRLALPG